MKNKLSIFALSFFIFRASFIGITSHYLLISSKQSSWITMFLGSLLSFFIVLLYYKISKKKRKRNIKEIIITYFPNLGKFINFFISLIIFGTIIINFFNLISLVSLQYLYKTPKLITSTILIIPIYYLSKSNENTFKNTIVLLFYISIFLIFFTIIGIIPKIDFTNLSPINEYNPLSNIIYPISFNTIPLIMILNFRKDDISKEFIYGFIFASVSLILILFIMISLLGIDLLLLFKYPDFFILKLAYDGFINVRLQNILGIQYIIDLIVYISLGLKYLSEKNYSKKNIFLPIILILAAYVINIYNIELYEKIIKVFKYILFLIPAFFIIILIKKEKKLSLKNDKFCNYN